MLERFSREAEDVAVYHLREQCDHADINPEDIAIALQMALDVENIRDDVFQAIVEDDDPIELPEIPGDDDNEWPPQGAVGGQVA